jgi:hypothetical protein
MIRFALIMLLIIIGSALSIVLGAVLVNIIG